nr:LOW QUALITY PROTEIN: DNA excision repair protein ERCC-1-like [Lepeophtheirus salmonis]
MILVNNRQKGNLLLKSIKNWQFKDNIAPDYVVGASAASLFLSIRYHTLHPDYIHERLKTLGTTYSHRIILVLVDLKEPHHALKELMRISILSSLTLLLAWSNEEAAKIIENYKALENKPPDLITTDNSDPNKAFRLIDALTSIKSINKTDASVLLSHFESLANIYKATPEEIALIPGLGPQKAQRLFKVLHQDFKRSSE